MRTIPLRLLVLGTVMLAPSASQLWAQEYELTRVVAVVNDEPISVHDLAPGSGSRSPRWVPRTARESRSGWCRKYWRA